MSTTQRVVRKQLAGAEDLLQGVGAVTQARGGGTYEIHKLDVPIPFDNLADLIASSAEFVRLYATDTKYTDYRRTTEDVEGIPTTTGTLTPINTTTPICGSFATGAFVFSNSALVYLADEAYVWLGAVPKSVPAGSSINSLGGLGPTAWVKSSSVNNNVLYFAEDLGVKQGLLLTDDAAIANTDAMKVAMQSVSDKGGGTLYCLGNFYTFAGEGLRIPGNVEVIGAGVGEWEPIYPTRPKTWKGTNFIFRGTGSKVKTFYGVTDMRDSGGKVTDSGLVSHSLTSFTNADAAGITAATLRSFSAAVGPIANNHYWGLKNLRIVNWMGSDGITDHSNTSNVSLGADWDIGLVSDNSEYCDVENVQVVGYWREFGILEIATAITESRSERNHFRRIKCQGRVGHGIRGPDRWAATASTNTVSIHYVDNHYWPTSGSFRGSDNNTYTYTGLSYSSPNLIFTGVSPDPTGITQVRHASTGFGNTEYQDVYSYSLNHVSGNTAAYFGLTDSKPLEVSGYPLRGVKARNYKCHTDERVVAHIHDASDLTFIDPQFEGAGLLIASPVSTEGTAVAQVGETRNLIMLGDSGTEEQDLQLFLPRTGFIQSLSIGVRGDLSGDFIVTPHRIKDLVLKTKSGKNLRVRNSADIDVVRVTDTGNVLVQGGGQLSLTGSTGYLNVDTGQNFALRNGTTTRWLVYGTSGNLEPGTANSQYVGTAYKPLAGGHTQTAFTVTSDENYKCDINYELTDTLLDAWASLKYCEFRFKDRVEAKGEQARYHVGLIAQRVKEVFEAAGIDPFKYGILGYDEWDDTYADEYIEQETPIVDEEGNVVSSQVELVKTGRTILVQAAGSRYNVNPAEALMLEAALTRRELNKLKGVV